jgi:small subunit ribosomal protein S17
MTDVTETPQRGSRKVRLGRVVSDKTDKTVVVSIDDARPHRIYKKVIRRQKHLQVHDEQNASGVGDLVRIMETRPMSKLKRWRVLEIVEKAR